MLQRADDRFAFGKNWLNFIEGLTEENISYAQQSLTDFLGFDSLTGLRFLDIGSGSGLSSLVAHRLGAEVFSFDYDTQSVEATRQMKARFAPDAHTWQIEQGSALDTNFLLQLGEFDVVYSWGVLHHTGDMWSALANMAPPVKDGGWLLIAIYNDQGRGSQLWRITKRLYIASPAIIKVAMVGIIGGWWELRRSIVKALQLQNPLPFQYWREYKAKRGMSRWHDYVDWIGGYPFEVASPEAILRYYRKQGFTLENLSTVGGGHGNNQYLFKKQPSKS